ncbi:MAG: bifunctional oligoribonuclease/PAP phosphatase NrnA [Ruminococcaceae bacterium]|nr:bifunctional oligoribonuclease/PAP phosphatase NrnA [Oscillospiraceae bacterium]
MMNDFSAESVLETAYGTTDIGGICDLLERGKKVLILSHVNPDGDTVGSAFALKAIVTALGGEARCVCANEPARRLRFLYIDQEDCTYTGDAAEYDLVLSIDVASPGQLGALDGLIPEIDLMIDHHGMGTPYATNYVDPTASAAGEIVFAIYSELKNRGKIGALPNAARRMYAAIVSDTGSFKFSNTTPLTHRIAAELVAEINGADDGGGDTADVCRSLFGQRTLKELIAQMIAIQNLRFYGDGALGAVLFTRDMLEEAGLTDDDIGNSVETPRGVEGVLVGISLRQSADDPCSFKVSSRANANIDVAAVCANFGGGGHVRAAGCTITADTPEEALETAVNAFLEVAEEYKSKQ